MLSLDEVRQQLDRLHPIFVAAHVGAYKRLQDVQEKYPEFVSAMNARERANVLHGQVRSLVAVGVEPEENAQVTEWDIDTVAVGFNLLVRFKFLGNGDPANNKSTEQQRLLDAQRYKSSAMTVLALAGITEPPTIVTCGYTSDGNGLGRVLIQRDCKGHERWNYDIHGGTAVVEPLRFVGMDEARPAVVRSRKMADLTEAERETGTETDV